MKIQPTQPEWIYYPVRGYEVRYYIWNDGFTEVSIGRSSDWKCVDYVEWFPTSEQQLDEFLAALAVTIPLVKDLREARTVVKALYEGR